MAYVVAGLIALAIGIACGNALYRAAERERRNPWVWGIAGFLTNVIALIVFKLRVGPILKNW
ncbi:hypothetical protein BH23CHL5_BH23CHL5_13060 [soil metagenome]